VLTFLFARFYITNKSGQPFWSAVKWNLPRPATMMRLLGLGVALALTVQFASSFLPIPKNLPVEQYFRSPGSIWLLAVFGTLVAPLAEEIYFRGLLFPALRRLFAEPESIAGFGILLWFLSSIPLVYVFYRYQRFSRFGIALLVIGLGFLLGARLVRIRPEQRAWSVVAAVIVTALLFALLHQGQLARAWVPLLMLFIVGLVLTGVRATLHSLAASWIVHVGYNGTLFVLLYIGTSGFRDLDKLGQ
jgi:membrane protease YdiL (CAAX protease family)